MGQNRESLILEQETPQSDFSQAIWRRTELRKLEVLPVSMYLHKLAIAKGQPNGVEEIVRAIKKDVPLVVHLQLVNPRLRRCDGGAIPGSLSMADIYDRMRMIAEVSGCAKHFLHGRANSEPVGRAGDDSFIKIGGPEIASVSGNYKDGGKHGDDQDSFP
ncbi:hypothetical protein ACWKWK_05560 [Pseudoxanthomonas beigongshangi]